MTDPQDDVPCRSCGALTQHATEICDDCRTPAGRLVTALRERGVKAEPDDSNFEVQVGDMSIGADPVGWSIISVADVDDEEAHNLGTAEYTANIEAAANAIAAIVQAPGLRAENATLAADVKRLRAALYQAKVAARFPDSSDAWDQVRDAVSALDEVPDGT